MIELYGLQAVFSARDLVSIYNQILQRLVPLDEEIGIKAGGSKTTLLTPDVYAGLAPADLREFSKLAAADVAIAKSVSDRAIIALACGVQEPSPPVISVKVDDVSLTGPNLPSEFVGSIGVKTDVPLRYDLRDILSDLSPDEVWNSAGHADDIHLAISLKVLQLAASSGRRESYKKLPKFFVGSDFLPSLRRNQGIGSGSFGSVVVDACARVVLGSPKNAVRPLRNSRNEDVVRAVDQALSQRTHLTSGHEALRLLFWSASEGVEFANIGVKSELKISEGG